tara:strand:+ start:1817 stop:3076 length:1260 start_codon:yes stop_codon:yes gene_type:complete
MDIDKLDRNLTKALKLLIKMPSDGSKVLKSKQHIRDICSWVSGEEILGIVKWIADDYLQSLRQKEPCDTEKLITSIKTLSENGFTTSSSLIFIHSLEILKDLGWKKTLLLAPDAVALEAWRKKTKMSVGAFEEKLLESNSYETAGADWLLLRANPTKIIGLIESFLSKQNRPSHLPAWSESLNTALKKDSKGALLNTILFHSWKDLGCLNTLADIVRLNPDILKNSVNLLPGLICKKDSPPQIIGFIDQLFINILNTKGEERLLFCASLIRLGTGVLLHGHSKGQAVQVLENVAKLSSNLKSFTSNEDLQEKTWVIENLKSGLEITEEQHHVTIQGACLLARGFGKAIEGVEAKDILFETAYNCGMREMGSNGDKVCFDPLKHEDVVGGLLPDEYAIIHKPGWTLGDEIITRAKVKGAE